MSGGDASAMAEVLVDANLRGVESHGFQRVPTYMGRVSAGLAGAATRSRCASGGADARIDAADALGPIGATRATDAAIELAREHGIGLVALGNSGHFGAAGYYARRVAGEGLIALVTTNGPGTMAPHGAAEPFVGTSALAIAVPLGRHEPFCLDMSASVVARGKVMRAEAQGTQLEPGIAIDADGRPTLDPAAALAGSVLPLGGPQGQRPGAGDRAAVGHPGRR
ncbi:MAG: Ldh family oxidoreductase [Thermoleophilaceae bacterium]